MGSALTSRTETEEKEDEGGEAVMVVGARLTQTPRLIQDWWDPYVVVRLGGVGTEWGEKEREYRSGTAVNSLKPEWRLAFRAGADTEATARVYDREFVGTSSDEFVGEATIRVGDLDDESTIELSNGAGELDLLKGVKVEDSLASEEGPFLAARLGTFFSTSAECLVPSDAYYWSNMAQLAVLWSRPCAKKDPVFTYWERRTDKNGVWEGPTASCEGYTLQTHQKVRDALENDAGKEGRENYLGFALLNPRFWPEVPWHCIGLGAPNETRTWLRPLLERLCSVEGKRGIIQKRTQGLFKGHVKLPFDLKVWTTKILHEVVLNVRLTESEACEFIQKLQMPTLIATGAPEAALKASHYVRKKVKLDLVVSEKAKWLEKYRDALIRVAPEVRDRSDDDKTAALSAILDALIFAGGQSVPTVLGMCLLLPYSKWGHTYLPQKLSLQDARTREAYALEVIRRFPPVAGLGYKKSGKTVFCNLMTAQFDQAVWGQDPYQFQLRDPSFHAAHSVGFAEPSKSHACPGKDLALCMILAGLREFTVIEGGHQNFEPRNSNDDILTPSDIVPTQYGILTTTILTKKSDLLDPPVAERFPGLPEDFFSSAPAAAAAASETAEDDTTSRPTRRDERRCRKKTRFDTACDRHTKMFIDVVNEIVDPSARPTSLSVRNFEPKGKVPVWDAPFGGLQFAVEDEDQDVGFFEKLQKAIFWFFAQKFEDDAEKLEYFETPVEASRDMEITFGDILPEAYTTWTDIDSDASLIDMVTVGAGAWYLKKDAGTGAYEVDLTSMAEYETRHPWKTYGARLTLNPDLSIDGIYSCSFQKQIHPGDPEWDEAKADFRCALGTSLTLKEHLCYTHWIVANGLYKAARETLSTSHPLRRLLKQFTFRTANINQSSKDFLLPYKSMGHRAFGFSWSGWVQYFTRAVQDFRYQPLPEYIKLANLPSDLCPLASDGLDLWRTFRAYVAAYLALFPGLETDPETVDFWRHFQDQISQPWGLPDTLDANTLADFLAECLWQVTAGHELFGAIVEYLVSPRGLVPKLAKNSAQADVQSQAQTLIIIALTGERQPQLIDDWSHLFRDLPNFDLVLPVLRRFQLDLLALARDIQARNQARAALGKRKVFTFDPRVLETSVSI